MNLKSKIIIFKFMTATTTVITDAVVVMHGSINANSIQSLYKVYIRKRLGDHSKPNLLRQ